MARDFSKNTSNYARLGDAVINPLINGSTAISMHCWAYPDSFNTGAFDNRLLTWLIDGGSAGGVLAVGSSPAVLKVGGRGAAADGFGSRAGTTTITTGAWWSLGGVISYSGDAMTPYVSGVAEGGGATALTSPYTAGTPTAASLADAIGSSETDPPVATANQWDGRIAEFAIWNVDIGSARFASLAKGFSALMVCPENLVFYMPLIGQSTDRNLVGSETLTITGTIAAIDHPRTYRPSATIYSFPSAAVGGGTVGVGLLNSLKLNRSRLVA